MGISMQQKLTFLVLYLSYGSTYFLRKPFGFMKPHIKADYSLDASCLGFIDLAFLGPYAIGALLMSGLVDKVGSKNVLIISLLGSAIATLCLFFVTNYGSFLFLLAISGTFQSLSWPSTCCLLTSWFPETSKTQLFGWFGTSCFVGSLFGSLLPVVVEVSFKNFELLNSVYIFAALIVLLAASFIPCCIRDSPSSVAYSHLAKKSSRSAFSCLFLPVVKEAALAMFFIKAVRYAFMFWLPYYLVESVGYTAIIAGSTALAFDVGGIMGSAFINSVSEKWFQGNEVLASIYSLIGSIFAIIAFFSFQLEGSDGWYLNIFWITLIGALNCGPDIVFTGSLAAKLGELHGCSSAVTSVINGMGSLGTMVEGPLVAYTTAHFGLSSISVFMGSFSVAALCLAYKANTLLEKEKRSLRVPEF